MKRFMPWLTATMFAVTLVFVNTGSGLAQTKDTDKKVYRDDDLSKSKMDENKSTLNKMENEQGKEGTSAGGVRDEDKGKMKSEDSGEKGTEEPYPPISY